MRSIGRHASASNGFELKGRKELPLAGKAVPVMIIALAGALIMSSCAKKDASTGKKDLSWWQQTIVYEIYVKSFRDSDGDGIGDINGIISELDHLKALGVGAIWLTPCYPSPQADNGYDITDYYDIDPAYGTMEDMDRLIEEAGKRDIRIVMDLVFNHTSDQNEWFRESRSGKNNDKSDWYIWRDPKEDGGPPTNWRSIFGGSAWEYDETREQYYLHTFLKEQPDLNWENPEVRQALTDIARFWVRKGVGGFRMDAITYIKKPEEFLDGEPDAADNLAGIHKMTANTEGILDFLHEFRSAVQDGTDIFTVGEANGVTAEDLPEWVGPGGVFDMVFEFSHVGIDEADSENWCGIREWTLPELKSIFAADQEATMRISGWYPMFLENHDQPRSISRYLPEGADRIAGGKALATLLLTMRGTPFIMEGEELGYMNVRWPSIDDYDDISTKNHYWLAVDIGYSEEEAMEWVHHFSRDSARTPMQWSAAENAGFTTGRPWLPVYEDYKTFYVTAESEDSDSILNWYVTLAALRKKHPVLVNGDFTLLFPEDEQIFAYVRQGGDGRATVLINMSAERAVYDRSCVENSEPVISSYGRTVKGVLEPLEAVIFIER